MPIRVVACVIERDGKLLLCRRPAHKRHGGLWEFPGGKVENGESDFDAVRRELEEELGITALSVGSVEFSQADAGSDFIIDFLPVLTYGEPAPLEHEELRWVDEADALELALAPSDREYVLHWRHVPRYYSRSVADFVSDDPNSVLGVLTTAAAARGFEVDNKQIRAWREEIDVLRHTLGALPELARGQIILEYPIPRRAKRPDAVVVCGDTVAVLEFKVGEKAAAAAARQQVEDYCLDLRDFHSASAGLRLIPILVPTESSEIPDDPPESLGGVASVRVTGAAGLRRTLAGCFRGADCESGVPAAEWPKGTYHPTPTIIEAACHLYANMDVREISRSHAGSNNLQRTTLAVLAAISEARAHGSKTICFITGVPGAGKTLAGLNIVHNARLHTDGDLGVLLSGNGPLVKVLREALARDEARRTGKSLDEARRTSATFVQGVHAFLDEYSEKSTAPLDRVVIFDEAQRAWNAEHAFRKFKRRSSEPALMLEIMNRHHGWAVIVGLIGGGQEINTGEAGLSEWGRVLEQRYLNWTVLVSNELLQGDHSTAGDTLFPLVPPGLDVITDPALHLRVCLRSYRAEKLSEWVALVLAGRADAARRVAEESLAEYPLFLTRRLQDARRWLRAQRRGTRRSGLLASSGARRLRPYGIDVTAAIDVKKWFLAPASDIRSSSFLEIAATEFAVQGLELDWAGLCWGADLRRGPNDWTFHQFRGSSWINVGQEDRKKYMLNKYRVLLTRAREGLVIWVPRGSKGDYTRNPEFYDGNARYLRDCGVADLTLKHAFASLAHRP